MRNSLARVDQQTGANAVPRLGRTALALLLGAVVISATPLTAQVVAITGGTVYPVSGPKIPGGTVLIRDGKIVAVGASVVIPAGALRVDATGKWITPGLIHANANAGLGVAGLNGQQEGSVQGDVKPSFNPAEGVDPAAFTIPIARTGGITTALLPPGGSFFPGQAPAVNYAGDRVSQMLVRQDAALVLDLTDNSRGAGGGSRAGTMARIRRLFADAREFARRKPEYQRAAIQPLSAPAEELEALLPMLRGEVPLAIAANRRIDIENALRLKQEYKLRVVLVGAVEGWEVAKEIAAAGVPAVIEPNRDIPSFDGLGARLDNGTLLRSAGVQVIIAQGDPGGERNLRYAAGNAVRNGMTWDDALKAVTQAPAQAFGLSEYGTLEAGKVANVVIWSGDPFDFASVAERVYIRGQQTSLVTRENELRDKYRTVPLP
ncbi:MAG TPA: amidohydrolase family protein [Gemmatimonadales bacterium]|nr:amidohydrolase family protein [Gemmatimonadales bacterium]